MRLVDIADKIIGILLFGLFFAAQHQQTLIMLTEDVIDIDAHEDLYLLDIFQLLAQLEIAR